MINQTILLSKVEEFTFGWAIRASRMKSILVSSISFIVAIIVLTFGFNPIRLETDETGYSMLDFILAWDRSRIKLILSQWGPNLVDRVELTTWSLETVFVITHALFFFGLVRLLNMSMVNPGRVRTSYQLLLQIAIFDLIENMVSVYILHMNGNVGTFFIKALYFIAIFKFLSMFSFYALFIFMVYIRATSQKE